MPCTLSPARAGLNEIIAGTGLSLDELIAAKRLFVQDYTPFASMLKPSPGNVAEAPTALFFLDGAGDADAALMPLAIKFNLQNNNTYSPKDSRADWLLVRRRAAAGALPAALLRPRRPLFAHPSCTRPPRCCNTQAKMVVNSVDTHFVSSFHFLCASAA